jgi:hypothetical protein
LIFEGSCPLVPKLIQAEDLYLYSIRLAAGLAMGRLAWQAGTPGKPWQNLSFPPPRRFIKPSKIKPAPPKRMEVLLKKEPGTAKVVVREILLRYRLSGNSHPGSVKN